MLHKSKDFEYKKKQQLDKKISWSHPANFKQTGHCISLNSPLSSAGGVWVGCKL